MSEREKTPVNNYANKHSHLYIFHAYHFIAVLQHWCRVSRVKETENQKDSGLPEVPQWWIKNRHPDLQRGNLTCVLLPLKWTRERMKTDRPHRLGFMKPATLFFSKHRKNGCLKHLLIVPQQQPWQLRWGRLGKRRKKHGCFDRSFLMWPTEEQTFITRGYLFIIS